MVHADTRAWEVDTLRGHVNNVSCVMFHARQVSQTHKFRKAASLQPVLLQQSCLFCVITLNE